MSTRRAQEDAYWRTAVCMRGMFEEVPDGICDEEARPYTHGRTALSLLDVRLAVHRELAPTKTRTPQTQGIAPEYRGFMNIHTNRECCEPYDA